MFDNYIVYVFDKCIILDTDHVIFHKLDEFGRFNTFKDAYMQFMHYVVKYPNYKEINNIKERKPKKGERVVNYKITIKLDEHNRLI